MMTGPNYVRCVVWALGELFLFSSCFFFVLNDYIGTWNILRVQCGSTRATTTTTGPNDASRVVWALGEFFIIISFF